MKLHMSIGQPEIAGYTNVDVTKHPIDMARLDNICEASECTHLIINDLLKLIPYEQLPVVVQHLATRLRHGGELTIIFTDLNSVLREYNRAAVDEKLFNQLMFSHGSRSCFSLYYLQRIIQAVKLEILNIDISKEQTVVILKRP